MSDVHIEEDRVRTYIEFRHRINGPVDGAYSAVAHAAEELAVELYMKYELEEFVTRTWDDLLRFIEPSYQKSFDPKRVRFLVSRIGQPEDREFMISARYTYAGTRHTQYLTFYLESPED